jgi:hypothetical protein
MHLLRKDADFEAFRRVVIEALRRDPIHTLETLMSDFVPPFPASRRPNVGALTREVSRCRTGIWDDAVLSCANRTDTSTSPGFACQ